MTITHTTPADGTFSATGTTAWNADHTITDLVVPGNATFGDASGDLLTINAGTWTIGSTVTATRAIGTASAGVTNSQLHNTTFSGDSGGTTTLNAYLFDLTASGANSITTVRNKFNTMTLAASAGTITTAAQDVTILVSSGAGAIATMIGTQNLLRITGAGNVTTGNYYTASAPTLSSTGAFTTLSGFVAGNLGHATLITNAIGFDQGTFTAAVTFTAGFRAQQNAGTGCWGFIHTGTANNAFNGNTRIGSNVAPTVALDVTGDAIISAQIAGVGGVTSAGNLGVPVVVASGRSTAQTDVVASVSAFTVGAADGSFEISANVNITTSVTHSITVTCAYTDETNVARTLTLGFTQLSGATFITAITNVTGSGPYESPTYHLRCKAATTITIATAGTFTSVTYNVEGIVKQTN